MKRLIHTRIPNELFETLKKRSKESKDTMTDIVIIALSEYLK